MTTQSDDLREETEQLCRTLGMCANTFHAHVLNVAGDHLRRLQQRNELLAFRAEAAEKIAMAAGDRLKAIEGALEWAAKEALTLDDDCLCVTSLDEEFCFGTVTHNGTGSSIADALIELAKRGGGA